MTLQQTWRWYGPDDAVTLRDIRQAGAEGIVSALHHIPVGDTWPIDEIQKRQQEIAEAGLQWVVVESVDVHEDIKQRTRHYRDYIENYKQTLYNLGQCGIETVCYNFMPVLDWTRTNLESPMPDESTALGFDMTEFVVFDLCMLQRTGAEQDYSETQKQKARDLFEQLSEFEKQRIRNSILASLPDQAHYTLGDFQSLLDQYKNIDAHQLKENLILFLQDVIPAAEEAGIRMAIHPDDPPYAFLGIPRVVSTEDDLRFIVEEVNSPANGLTFCTGSLGVRPENDLPGMIERLGNHIHFVHLRSVKRLDDGSFYESNHLEGDVDMYAVMRNLLQEQRQRQLQSPGMVPIPFRPDHGHKMLDDMYKQSRPGYPAVGRLRGLAELRGLEMGIEKTLYQ